VWYSQGYQPGHGGQDQGMGTVKDINDVVAVRNKVGQNRGYQPGNGGQDQGRMQNEG